MNVILSKQKYLKNFLYSFLFLLGITHIAHAEVKNITICGDEQKNWPWLMSKKSGITYEYLNTLEKNINSLNIKFILEPWKRCTKLAEMNQIDAIVNISFNIERSKLLNYPIDKANANLIDNFRLYKTGYYFYKIKNSKITWDGKKLTHNTNPVITTLGYSIVDKLKNDLGIKVIERNIPVEEQMELLIKGNFEVLANLEKSTDFAINNNPKFETIQKLLPSIQEKSYFLAFTKKFYQENYNLCQKIWNEISKTRDSQNFIDKIQKYLPIKKGEL